MRSGAVDPQGKSVLARVADLHHSFADIQYLGNVPQPGSSGESSARMDNVITSGSDQQDSGIMVNAQLSCLLPTVRTYSTVQENLQVPSGVLLARQAI